MSERVSPVVEKLLPLAYHSKICIVQENDLDCRPRLMYRPELLYGHLEAAIPEEHNHLPAGSRYLRAHRCRKPEPHRTESAGCHPSSFFPETGVTGCEHLVLPHIRYNHRIGIGISRHRIHCLSHSYPVLRLSRTESGHLSIKIPVTDDSILFLCTLRCKSEPLRPFPVFYTG